MSRKLTRAAILTLAAFVGAAILDYAFVTGSSWFLSPKDYGVLGVASTWFLLLSFFVANGFPMSLAKYLAENEAPTPGLVRYALRANFILGLAMAALFLGLTFYGPLSPGPGYGRLVWSIAIATVLLAIGSTLQYALQGRMAFSQFALLHASKSFHKLAVGAALVVLGFGVAGAVGGLVVGGAFLCVASWIALRRSSPEALAHGALDPELKRRFLRETFHLFAGSFALTLLMSLDLLGLKYLAPSGDSDVMAARYQAATILTKAPLWAVMAALSVLFPIMSRTFARDPRAASKLLKNVLRWMALILAPAVLVLVAFPSRVLAIVFPNSYADAAPVLVVSAIAMAALALCLVLSRALQASARAHHAGAYLVVSLAIQAALLVALVPKYGPMGAAIATATGALAGAILALSASARAFHLRAPVRDLIGFGASLLLLGATIAAIRAHGRIGTIATFALAGLAYGGAAVLLGLVRKSERDAVLRRVLPRAWMPDAGTHDA